MRTPDRHVLLHLDDLEAVIADLRRIYPAAVASAEAVRIGGRSDGVTIRSTGISDPTGEAATDPRRARRYGNLKKARREVKAAVTSARAALAHAMLAADK